ARDLVVAREPGQDGEAGRVRRGPAGRTETVRAEAPDRARARVPAGIERVQLVEAARRAVDADRVPIPVRLAAALDRDVRGDRVRPAVALLRVLEPHAHLRLRAADDGDRDPDRRTVPEARAEIRVEPGRGADRGDD